MAVIGERSGRVPRWNGSTANWPHRVDERVGVEDVAGGGVERQAEAERVAQALLQAHGPQQQHVPGRRQEVSPEPVPPAEPLEPGSSHLEPGGRDTD